MRWFTPELYLKGNSSNEDVVNEAGHEWEIALQEYSNHLAKCNLPPDVAKLSKLCLHDAELVETIPFINVPSFTISVRTEKEEDVRITYSLAQLINIRPPIKDWRFSAERRYWLYDEIDANWSALKPGEFTFLHRILFSDGRVFEIPFTYVEIK